MTIKINNPACYGMHDLFDSTETWAHREAAAICARCPAIVACRQLLEAETHRPHDVSARPAGTWAGQLLGRPVKTMRRAS